MATAVTLEEPKPLVAAEEGGNESGKLVEKTVEFDGTEVHSIPSLCMACGQEGMTSLMLTVVPHFREIVLMAFECPHCNERNNEIQFAGQLQPQGCRITLTVPEGDREAQNRQVVKSDSATLKIPELEFEVPPESQKGTLSTVEGVLRRAISDLQLLQDERKRVDPQMAEALDTFLKKLASCADGERGFTLILDDPAGNSFIQSLHGVLPDPMLSMEKYDRSGEQNEAMGFLAGPSAAAGEEREGNRAANLPSQTNHSGVKLGAPSLDAAKQSIAEATGSSADALLKYTAPEEVMVFPGHCGACGAATEQRMFMTNIPYFKEVIIMALSCDMCGWRNSELKGGGSVPPKGRRSALRVKNKRDLTRDVIKSDTASVAIPELELELTAGTLGGRVTTVEGLLTDIGESLKRVQGFSIGDSAPDWQRSTWNNFQSRLSQLLEVEEEWTLVLDDALANSFIAPSVDNMEDDLQLASEDYDRSWEQDEELGLHDINTENYALADPDPVNEQSEQN